MTTRHFAYFRQSDGRYVREWKGDVADPPSPRPLLRVAWLWRALVRIGVSTRLLASWPRRALTADQQRAAMHAWATAVSAPEPGEVALDVSMFDYPVGDFQWMVLRFGEGKDGQPLLDWPEMHTFAQVNRETGRLFCYWESARPVRSSAETAVIDVTGTVWERFYRERGGVFGTFTHDAGICAFVPDALEGWRAALPEAADLDVFVRSPIGVPVLVGAER